MSFTNTFQIEYHDEVQMVKLRVRQSDTLAVTVSLTFEEWDGYIEQHRDENTKYIEMSVPMSLTSTQHIRVPSRDFRQLVAEHDLRMKQLEN